MPTITTNDLKNGMALELDDGLFEVVHGGNRRCRGDRSIRLLSQRVGPG